jgi:hypothetical protein
VIIEKSPFGKSMAIKPMVTNQSASLVLTGAFCGDATKKVWIKDIEAKQSHYVGEGDKVLEYTVVSIDCSGQTVLLSRGLTELLLAFPANRPLMANAVRPDPMSSAGPASQTTRRPRILREHIMSKTSSVESWVQPTERTKENDAPPATEEGAE